MYNSISCAGFTASPDLFQNQSSLCHCACMSNKFFKASCAEMIQAWSHIQHCPAPSQSCSTSTAKLCHGPCGTSRPWPPPQSVCPATLVLKDVYSTPQNQYNDCMVPGCIYRMQCILWRQQHQLVHHVNLPQTLLGLHCSSNGNAHDE